MRKTRKSPERRHKSTTDRQMSSDQRGTLENQPLPQPQPQPQSTASPQQLSSNPSSFPFHGVQHEHHPHSIKPNLELDWFSTESAGNIPSNSLGLTEEGFQSLVRSTQKKSSSEKPSAASDAQKRLAIVSEQFAKHYNKFLSKHKQYVRVDEEVQLALQYAEGQSDISRSATLFKQYIENVFEIKSRRDQRSQSSWHGKVGRFLTALYPVAKISVGMAGAVGEVYPVC